jgi:hypothetical protein
MPKKTTVTKKTPTKKVAVKKVVKKVVKKPVAKKTVLKKATKKATTQKVATKKTRTPNSKKQLIYTDEDLAFWVNDGQILNSLMALNEALDSMEKAIFTHHVNSEKHDFANWVDSALCDEKCAAELRKTKTQKKAYGVVSKHLKTYNI